MKNRITNVIWALVAIAGLIAIIISRRKISDRINNAIITKGIIYDKGKKAKGLKYIPYTFSVDGNTFYGTVSIEFCNQCKENCCDIGDSVNVRYEQGNPDNNDLIH